MPPPHLRNTLPLILYKQQNRELSGDKKKIQRITQIQASWFSAFANQILPLTAICVIQQVGKRKWSDDGQRKNLREWIWNRGKETAGLIDPTPNPAGLFIADAAQFLRWCCWRFHKCRLFPPAGHMSRRCLHHVAGGNPAQFSQAFIWRNRQGTRKENLGAPAIYRK